jgi:hypothetical protein
MSDIGTMLKMFCLLMLFNYNTHANFIKSDLDIPGGMEIKVLDHGYSPLTGHIFKFEPAKHPDQGVFYTSRASLIKSILNLNIKKMQRKPKFFIGKKLLIRKSSTLKTLLPPKIEAE